MPGYKSYVSPSRNGILSDNPGSYEHDTAAEQYTDPYRVPYGASPSARKLSGTALPDIQCRDDAESQVMDKDAAGHEKILPLAGSSCCSSDCPSACASGPDRKGSGFLSSLRCLCHGRILAAALAVNGLLVLFFALIMYLDRPVPPTYVYYIDLVDGPDTGDAGKIQGKQGQSEGAAEKSLPQNQPASGR